jgi:hypothetical protein
MAKSSNSLKPRDIMTGVILIGCMILIGCGKDGVVHSTFEITVAVAIGEKVHEMRKQK